MASVFEKLPQVKNIAERLTNKREVPRSKDKILEMSPKELVDYLGNLQKKGKLESFLKKTAKDESLVALFSYWEKWLQEDQRRLLDEAIAKKREVYGESGDSLPLRLDKKFNEQELKLIFSNLKAIQLTFGCSKGCPFCGLDAVPKVREQIPYSPLANLFQKYGNLLRKSELILYWASEPSDYASKEGLEDKTYKDVHQLAERYAGYSPHITSKEVNNLEWVDFLGVKGNARLSVFGLDAEKIKAINETIKGKDIITIGGGRTHQKGVGISSFLYADSSDIQKIGIGCFDGVLLTPRGLYNIVQTEISEKFPQGQIIVPIESLSDKRVKVGDSLNQALRERIVCESDFWQGHRGFIKILQKDGDYYVDFGKDGIITDVEKKIEEKDCLKAIQEKRKTMRDLMKEALASKKTIHTYDISGREFGISDWRFGQAIEEKIKEFDFDKGQCEFFNYEKRRCGDTQEWGWLWEWHNFRFRDKYNKEADFDISIGLKYRGDISRVDIGKPGLALWVRRVTRY